MTADISKIKYCDKKLGNSCTCSNLATHKVILKNRFEKDIVGAKEVSSYRCDKHENTSTVGKVVVESTQIEQSNSISEILK